jgi:hypothetical protein
MSEIIPAAAGSVAHETIAQDGEGFIVGAVRRLFTKKAKPPKAKIEKSANGNHDASDAAGAKKVGLKPKRGWRKRSFLTSVLIPSLFKRRELREGPPEFPKLKKGEIGVTWIGHASFLLQFGTHNVLIDPNWARWLKIVKRLKMPGLHLHELPEIDLVLVTHAHFDHLDRKTLRKVAADQPIVVPFEVGNLVHDLGFRSVHELGYWESYKLGPLTVTLTPCAHWGARVLHDTRVHHRARRADGLPLRGHGVFRRVQGDREALQGGRGADADRRVRSAERARGPHESRGGAARISRAGRKGDGTDALRHVPAELRADGGTAAPPARRRAAERTQRKGRGDARGSARGVLK